MKSNVLDIAPNYAAPTMSISNGIAALTGIAAVSFVELHEMHTTNYATSFSLTSLVFSLQTARYQSGDLSFGLLALCWLQPTSFTSFSHQPKFSLGIIRKATTTTKFQKQHPRFSRSVFECN